MFHFFLGIHQNLPNRLPGIAKGGLFKLDARSIGAPKYEPPRIVPDPAMVFPGNREPKGSVPNGNALDIFGIFRLGIVGLLGRTSLNEGSVPTASVGCGPVVPVPLVVAVVPMPCDPESPLPGKPC